MNEVREARSFGYGRIPNTFVEHYMARVGVSASAVYMVLSKYADGAGRSFPSIETIGKIAGICRQTVVQSLHKLRDENLLSIEERPGRNSIFVLLQVEAPPIKNIPPIENLPPQNLGGESPEKIGGVSLYNLGGVPPIKGYRGCFYGF